ncbi:MAG: fumarylacetoacetate hydrolase, partial [Kiloniellales bacterium]|nr:fumarylacetoacetate hydrolase [Kiloniellales bacterium]
SAAERRDPALPYFLAPCDLQALKACGVTFVRSLLERVIEEHIKGDPSAAEAARRTITAEIGADLAEVVPGSEQAARLQDALIARGLWSQYIEVGIGPDAEVFSKSQPLSAVGTGAEIGLHPDSVWNNPEPEVVLVINARGETVGATLGNDVNLRDIEGRSALLLGRSKDNNGSCASGPFIRLFDTGYGIDDLRRTEVELLVEGDDGFRLSGRSAMSEISRDPLDLAAQAIGPNHQYPDGLLLFTGTMFAPIEDRDVPGEGFTHKLGDRVTISSPDLGALVNRVGLSNQIPPWDFGIAALMQNLSARGLL